VNLGVAFARTVVRDPGAVAIVDGSLRRTYGEWYDEIRRAAGGLRALGIGAGSAFVPVMSNRHEAATLYWACQLLGARFIPFNWRASADEIAYVLKDADAEVVACDERSAAAVAGGIERRGFDRARLVAVGCASGRSVAFGDLLRAEPVTGPSERDPRETCLMLYTSGTTGRPKGVPRSHDAERNAALACLAQLGYAPREATLGVMPLFHTMGMRALLMSMMLNGKFVCMAAFDAEAAMRLIAAEEIGTLFLVPTMFHDIVNHPRLAAHDVSCVRKLGFAGMSMTTGLTRKCVEVFRPDVFVNYYGSSEIYSFAVCDHVAEKPGCAGRAALNQEIRVVRADPEARSGPDEVLPQGEVGEVIAPMDGLEAFRGYWKRPDADRKAIRGGWYFTGDLGYLDADGELFLVGRVDDMIISGGENIHAEEVEDVLDRSPLVRQAAVVGLPDERLGQKVVAFIEPASGETSAEALDQWCLASPLARFKRPRGYVFVERIPKSASGKLLRRFLRDGAYDVLPNYKSTL
jgi:2-furoate---CoA ligase